MARATFVKAAQKDYPEQGIKKGESYYWWKFRHGPKRFSKTPPKASQLTQSEFLSTLYQIEEQLGELTVNAVGPSDNLADLKNQITEVKEDLKSAVDDIVSQLEDLKSETDDKYNNMPDGLQQGDTGQLLQGRVDAVQSMIDELEAINFDDDDQTPEDLLAEVQAVSYQGE